MAKPFLARVKRRVGRSVRSWLKLGVECNLCGWTGARFESDNWHPHTICPSCQSQVRHRLLAATLRNQPDLSYARLIDDKAVLHFAPEPSLTGLIKPRAAMYRTADLKADPGRAVDLSLDIAQMGQIRNGEFDLAIACDVLEHVANDRSAMRELHRILRPGGYAILTVPQQDDLATTFEDLTATTPQAREVIFGQYDHVRIYGADFDRQLVEAGFAVQAIDESHFAGWRVRRNVLAPPIPSRHPLATNHRRIYFARTKTVAG